ncbi:hypothetical protein [Methylobacterium nodulans]|uniref:Uncharacterized protein n=1 Tax=Methylobacterium nodulans (strain LMG 21967 / CNCM I-2342 / ORS 2060) TaxID=460265 RepID=B8IMS1_METNO|nr:hypothetical protein [Methylobacterium nodulans]ACL60264.1 conserved hypothetical protein [Methylobacterium nodulans ORS 2060]
MAEPAPAPDRTRDAALAGSIAALTLAVVLVANLAPAARQAPHRPADDPTCLEWTDDCVVCTRVGDAVACSMPGIACVRRAPRCTRR